MQVAATEGSVMFADSRKAEQLESRDPSFVPNLNVSVLTLAG